MGKRDPRIDAYIAKSAEFARPLGVIDSRCWRRSI
jgi:hypothetical protein